MRRVRRADSFSDNILYPQTTLYLRIAQMILSLACLGLTFLFWHVENTIFGITVVLFATSLGALVVTVVDVLASFERKQYTAPVWVGISTLAAFMFFLSFGFLVVQDGMKNVLIGFVFGITGIVFLIDAIVIIVSMLRFKVYKKIHPMSDEPAYISYMDQEVQVEDDIDIIHEVPIEVRKYEPVSEAVPRKISFRSSSKGSFPITSYGGTFPVGGNDAAPLPTPEKLTGLESPKSTHSYTARRSSQEGHPLSREQSANAQAITEENRHLYPLVEEEIEIEEDVTSNTRSESEGSQRMQATTVVSTPRYSQPVEEAFTKEHVGVQAFEAPKTQRTATQQMEKLQYERQAQYTAAGEPNVLDADVPAEGRKQRSIVSAPQGPVCNCCATRPVSTCCAARQICNCCANRPVPEPREQITPFVSHQYNQSPCSCGYTHYQATTVVKGAVRQDPKDTVKQQQRIIKEQLEQARDDQIYRGCTCHGKRL